MRIGDLFGMAMATGVLLTAGAACRREQRFFSGTIDGNLGATGDRRDTQGTPEQPTIGASGPYAKNAWGMSEGQRLYAQMNCLGCHAHGGGGMGPPLMDSQWIYGFDDIAIFSSIVNGRPNGMPSFRGRLSDDQAWQLVAYVKSLGGNASKFAAAVRDDHMAVAPGPALVEPSPIVQQKP